LIYIWRERVGIEPTKDSITAPLTVLKCVQTIIPLFSNIAQNLIKYHLITIGNYWQARKSSKKTQNDLKDSPQISPHDNCPQNQLPANPIGESVYRSIR